MDKKYGRLFTEDDVRTLVEVAMSLDEEINIQTFIDEFEGKFPVDEALFLLRAQDKRALGAIRFYYDHQSPRANQGHLDAIQHAIDSFDKFRLKNVERVKEPD